MTAQHDEQSMDTGKTSFEDEDGDQCVSRINVEFWRLCLLAQKQFDCSEIIFTYSDASYPMQTDAFIDFYVPRYHSRADEIVAFLLGELEPIRQSLDEFHPSMEGWRPVTYASIYKYSGITGALAHDEASRAVLLATADVPVGRTFKDAMTAGQEAAQATRHRRN
jgi:hypothetical protein